MPDDWVNGSEIKAVDLGLRPYRDVWQLQQKLHEGVIKKPSRAFLLKVEHHPVLTLGKHAVTSNLLLPITTYFANGIDIVEVDRGGEVTAHNPGQLVIYPILSVREFGLTPKRYVQLLERVVVELLEQFGIKASLDSRYPGVWVGEEKVCALGVRIKDRVTMHGLALNVDNDLTLFEKIIPCGIIGRQVTSLANLGGPTNLEIVFQEFIKVWQKHMGKVGFIKNFEEIFRA